MAPLPPAPGKPGAKNPRQRRMMIAGGLGLVAALFFMLRGGSGGGGQGQQQTEEGSAAAAPFGSTYADNGEAAGGLSSAITDALGSIGSSFDDLSNGIYGLQDQLATTGTVEAAPGTNIYLGATAPGGAAAVASPAKKVAKKGARAPVKYGSAGTGQKTQSLSAPVTIHGGAGIAKPGNSAVAISGAPGTQVTYGKNSVTGVMVSGPKTWGGIKNGR